MGSPEAKLTGRVLVKVEFAAPFLITANPPLLVRFISYATLGVIPAYPKPAPFEPSAVVPAPWMTNAAPFPPPTEPL